MQIAKDDLVDFDFLTDEQKKVFIRALIYLAKTDGKFDDNELEYITAMADIHGISSEEIMKNQKSDNEEAILSDLKMIDNRRVALEIIKELCFLAHTDDVLSPEETVFIGKCGLAMGIELEKIEQISNWVIDRIIWLEQAKLIFED